MVMRITARTNIELELVHPLATGSTWQVRVSRKFLGIKRTMSNDWFLDEAQARRFILDLAKEIESAGSLQGLRDRKPGWTLRPSP
jgi:hypothetical protein